jgi:hypothetical protein
MAGEGLLELRAIARCPPAAPEFTFYTTAGSAAPSTAYADAYPKQPTPTTEVKVANANLTLSPTQGPVNTRATLRGNGFPAGKTLQVVWETYVGSRVSGNGFASQEMPLDTVKVTADGRIDYSFATPDDLGGLHALMLRDGTRCSRGRTSSRKRASSVFPGRRDPSARR